MNSTKTDPVLGLSGQEAAQRMAQGLNNRSVASPSKSVWEIILGNVCTYFNLVFTVIAAMLILVGAWRDLTFYLIIIANTLIGIVQEVRSKKELDKLQVLNTPKATVLREGQRLTVPVEELVLDDIVLFSAGNQISADAVVAQGTVQVNESLLTGESDEVVKKEGDTLLSGSYVVSGSCRAQLTQVGEDSYAARLTLEAKASRKGEQSEMIRALNKLVKMVGILIIPIGALLFAQHFLILKVDLTASVKGTVAAILGMIPEGLYLLASVALVVSVLRLARQKVLVHDMKCIETLARVDVLCVDKTGTITEDRMEVVGMEPMEGYDSAVMPPLEVMLGRFAGGVEDENATIQAIRSCWTAGDDGVLPERWTAFSSACKYSSAVFDGRSYVLGAPEFVLREQYGCCRQKIEMCSAQGYRALVFCLYHGEADGKALTAKVTPLALVLLTNPIRSEASGTFRYFAQQGVAVKVISGDNPLTVSQVAKQAGIPDADRWTDASALVTEQDYLDAAAKYAVFGRVKPNQKRELVRALKKLGHTVAMTGDGVNDILALKEADCSVAMASGSDAAAQAAQLVLLESDFARMPSVVLEGRRVVNNIQRSASLFLVKNIFSFLMSAFTLCAMITYPLEPSQVSLVSMFTIGMPAFLLAMEPNKSRIEGRFLPNVLMKAIPAGVTDFVAVSAMVFFCDTFRIAQDSVSTACALLLVVVGMLILHRISAPANAFRRAVWFAMLFGLLGAAAFLGDLFALRSLSIKCAMLLVVFAVATESLLRYFSLLLEKGAGLLRREKEKFYRTKEVSIASPPDEGSAGSVPLSLTGAWPRTRI